MKQITYVNNSIVFGATTLKDTSVPENNNMALHVCLDPEKVMINRYQLSQELNQPLSNWALPWQKHTANIYEVTQKDKQKGAFDKDTSIMNVDAVYTCEKNILIGVFTADCVGIFLVDETKPSICCIHSGWKGTVQAITDKCVKELIQNKIINPKTTKAFFSPSILFDSLEVGMEVIEQIKQLNFDVKPFIRYMPNQKAFIDNQGLNIQMLLNNGLNIDNIYPSKLDTKKELNDCFSFRNDKKTGEHFTYGYIK